MPPITALHGARAGLVAAEHDDAPLPRAVRRSDLRHPRFRRVPEPRNRSMARQILLDRRGLAVGGPAPPARLRARSAQFRLRRPSAHLPAIRPVAALCEPRRGLPEFRLGRPAPLRAQIRWPLGAGAQRHRAGAARRHRHVTSPARLPAAMRRFSRAQCREDLLLTTRETRRARPTKPREAALRQVSGTRLAVEDKVYALQDWV